MYSLALIWNWNFPKQKYQFKNVLIYMNAYYNIKYNDNQKI